jgi:hypothetical protein
MPLCRVPGCIIPTQAGAKVGSTGASPRHITPECALIRNLRQLNHLAVIGFDQEIERFILTDFEFDVTALDPQQNLFQAGMVKTDVTLPSIIPQACSRNDMELYILPELIP